LGRRIVRTKPNEVDRQFSRFVEEGSFEQVADHMQWKPSLNTPVDGKTPLHRAVERGDYKLVQFLLLNGADPAIRDHRGDTVLHKAADMGRGDLLDLIFEYGGNPEWVDKKGRYADHRAREAGHKFIADHLLKRRTTGHGMSWWYHPRRPHK